MAKLTRRDFIGAGLGVSVALASSFPAFAAKAGVNFKVGVTDWNLKQEGKIEAIALAKKLGFDGVQVSIGHGRDKLPLSDPALQQAFLDESKRVNLPIESLCLEILHHNYLKSDPLGQRWVADAIPIAKAMNVRVILLPFFGKGALTNVEEMDKVGDALKEVAPAAERSGRSPRARGHDLRPRQRSYHGADQIPRRSHLLRCRQLQQRRVQRSGGNSPGWAGHASAKFT